MGEGKKKGDERIERGYCERNEEQVREKGGNGSGIDYSDYVASNSTVRTA